MREITPDVKLLFGDNELISKQVLYKVVEQFFYGHVYLSDEEATSICEDLMDDLRQIPYVSKVRKEKDMENLKCKIEDMIGEALNDIFLHYQEQFGITSGDCDPLHSYEMDKKTGELAELVVEILKAQKDAESEYDPVLCGFVWNHGDKDLSAWQVDLSEEDATIIEGILEKYNDKGCSVRNCYDSKFSEVF